MRACLAQHCDIEKMMEICEENLLENNREKFSANDFSNKGFLLTRLTSQNVQEMIDDKKNYVVLVAKDGDKIMGYLIACDIEKVDYELREKIKELKNFRGKVFYHKQIVKKLGVKQVGEKLLLSMLDEVNNRGYSHVVCRIVHEPFYNQASISFHQKFGFSQVGLYKKNEVLTGIYLKDL